MKLRQSRDEFQYARDLYRFIQHLKEVIVAREPIDTFSYRLYEYPEEPLSKGNIAEICARSTFITKLLFIESNRLNTETSELHYPGIKYWVESCPSVNPTRMGIQRAFKIGGGYVGGFYYKRGTSRSDFEVNSWLGLDLEAVQFEGKDKVLDHLYSERERINKQLRDMVAHPNSFIEGLDTLILHLQQNPPNEKKPLEVSAAYTRTVTVESLE